MEKRLNKVFATLTCAITLAATQFAISGRPMPSPDCEGNACAQVALTWDNTGQQYRVQNDSDRRVKIDVTTFAGDSTIHVEPQKSQYLLVKTFNGP